MKKKFKLAVVPKVHWLNGYSRAFGSQHDYYHILRCLNAYTQLNNFFDFKIKYYSQFIKNYNNFDGVLFLGSNEKSYEFIKQNKSIKKFLWSFNQYSWVNEAKLFNNVDIVFEQSNENLDNYKIRDNLIPLPLAFQSDINYLDQNNANFDLVFNGTLDREARLNQKFMRKDLLLELLRMNLKIINYNGRSHKKVEKNLLNDLRKYDNFKVINKFGEAQHYRAGKFSLDLPFLNLGAKEGQNWGMSSKRIDNGIWLNHWDTFRSIGSKTNLITYDAPEVRNLGISEKNVNFYKSDPSDLKMMAEEIFLIVKNCKAKEIDNNTWKNNTYISRYIKILDNINESINKISVIKKSSPITKEKLQIGIPCGYNCEHYVQNLISSIEELKSGDYDIEIILSVNHKKVDIDFLSNLETDLNLKIYKNFSLFGFKDSYEHGKNIDFIISKFNAAYGAIMDCDTCILIKNWDKILINELTLNTIIIGTPYEEVHYLKFPNAIFCIFKTQIIKKLKISFKPKKSFFSKILPIIPAKVKIEKINFKNKKYYSDKINNKIYLDVGFELPLKIKKNLFDGKSFSFIHPNNKNSKLNNKKGEEYHYKNNLILTHLGRSTQRNYFTNEYSITWRKNLNKWILKESE